MKRRQRRRLLILFILLLIFFIVTYINGEAQDIIIKTGTIINVNSVGG